MANTTQGMYAPLPQSMSDSDSEKELQIDTGRTKSINGIHKNFERSINGYVVSNHALNTNKVKHGFTAMSLTRRYCFLLSILVCFLTIAIFLWVLPCSENSTCPMHISSWENQHEDLEFKGKINVVKSAFANSDNLALLFKKSLNDASSRNGAISILGKNGGVAWYIPQVKELTDLNCYLIDVNGDDVNDCLLLGEMGLEAIDPISGQILYHVHNHNSGNIGLNNIDMPVILSDLNKDGVSEMITVINGNSNHNKLVIICGKTGIILSKVVLRHCLVAHGLKFANGKYLYSCRNSTTTKYFEISFNEIENRYYNKSYDIISIPTNSNDTTNTEYKLSNHQLIINNTGTCPECHCTIYLIDNQKNPLWSLAQRNCYAMQPTTFAFKSTTTNMLSLKGHINGYILKLWQWTNYKMGMKDPILDKRYPNMELTFYTNAINERVVLITFNDTNVHVINVSYVEITQLCFPVDGEYSCQPDLINQKESLLITDLDNDKSQELVSYSSTFELKDGLWKLFSNMKVIRLEAELPKLYEVAK